MYIFNSGDEGQRFSVNTRACVTESVCVWWQEQYFHVHILLNEYFQVI